MIDFYGQTTGPLIRLMSDMRCEEGCGFKSDECNFLESMPFIRYVGIEEPPAPLYAGQISCKGERPITDEERDYLEKLGKTGINQVCNVEVLCARDF